MAKGIFYRLASMIGATSAINGIITQIEYAFQNTLSRDGSSPNHMAANLDMNSNRILNLPAPIDFQEPVRLVDLTDLITNGNLTITTTPADTGYSPLTPEDYSASGSSVSTTCSTNAGVYTIVCADASTWSVGQGIRINYAGAAYSGSAPSSLGVTQGGTSGATSFTYWVRPIGTDGSFGPAVSVSTTTSNATLSYTNYNIISWTASPSGVIGYAIYKGVGTGTLIGVTDKVTFRDFGVVQVNQSDWLPSDTSVTSQAKWHLSTVVAKDTNTLTLSSAPVQTIGVASVFHDDTQAIKNMIADAVTKRHTFVLSQEYFITSTIAFNIPGRLTGTGSSPSKSSTLQSSLIWKGGPGEVLTIGGTSGTDYVSGGYVDDLEIDGQGMATSGLVVRDARNAGASNVVIRGTTGNGLLVTNSAGVLTYACTFDDLYIPLQDANMTEAHAITIDGYWDGVTGVYSNSGLTNLYFRHPIGSHLAGHGFYWPGGTGHGGGDGITISYPQMFRTTAASGYSLSLETTDTTRVTGDIAITGIAQMGSGINIVTPGRTEGMSFDNLDLVNVRTFALNAMPFLGAGKNEFAAASVDGTYFGYKKYNGGCALATRNDDMQFITVGSGVLTTANGSWLTQATSGAAIAAGSGGLTGVNLTTGATTGSRAAIYYPANQNGFKVGQYPQVLISNVISTQTKLTAHWGFFADTTATTTDFIGISYDPDVSPNFLCTTISGGVATTVDSGRNPGLNNANRWRIEVSPTEVVFYRASANGGLLGTAPPSLWYHIGTITTNIPTVFLRAGVSITANENVAKTTNLTQWSESHFMSGW